jgi:plasmid maintenance system antidote protein VapI
VRKEDIVKLWREMTGLGSRPYPLDKERRKRVMVALAEKDMTISALAKRLGFSKQYISAVINGRRMSAKTEKLIAEFLGKSEKYLFPFRTGKEISEMRRAEAAKKGNAA